MNFGAAFNVKDRIKIASLVTYVFSSDPLQEDQWLLKNIFKLSRIRPKIGFGLENILLEYHLDVSGFTC